VGCERQVEELRYEALGSISGGRDLASAVATGVARRDYDKVIGLDPKHANAYSGRALAGLKAGRI
jgi:hypothetical protein